MYRRHFLASALSAPALFGKSSIGLDRISLLTDEAAKTEDEAIAFAHQYGLKWLELRGVPSGNPNRGQTYAFMEPEPLKAMAKRLKDERLKVSFLNTPMLKFGLPGTEPARNRPEAPEAKEKRQAREQQQFAQRMDDLRKAIRAAHIFDVKKIRVFTFTRVAEPETLFPRIAEIIGELCVVAEKEGVQLLVENEGSCNVATSAETAALMKLVPSKAFGINWDPVNALSRKETPYPDGYKLLPKERLHNVQMKARALIIGPDLLDWKAIFADLARDGYKGQVGLETHVFDGTLVEKAHLCMAEIKKLTAKA